MRTLQRCGVATRQATLRTLPGLETKRNWLSSYLHIVQSVLHFKMASCVWDSSRNGCLETCCFDSILKCWRLIWSKNLGTLYSESKFPCSFFLKAFLNMASSAVFERSTFPNYLLFLCRPTVTTASRLRRTEQLKHVGLDYRSLWPVSSNLQSREYTHGCVQRSDEIS